MNLPAAHVIETPTHGRYLVKDGEPTPAPRLVGFHGYAEAAEIQLERMASIPGSARWQLISIQGLHRFYRGRTEQVVSSWMTRQDRDLALGDNVAYVNAVLDRIAASSSETGRRLPLVFAGFSQGVAMAFRAACHQTRHGATVPGNVGVVAIGGDVPPELDHLALGGISHVLLCRGVRDEWYTDAKWTADTVRLRAAVKGDLAVRELDAAHEWTPEFSAAAGRFLDDQLKAV